MYYIPSINIPEHLKPRIHLTSSQYSDLVLKVKYLNLWYYKPERLILPINPIFSGIFKLLFTNSKCYTSLSSVCGDNAKWNGLHLYAMRNDKDVIQYFVQSGSQIHEVEVTTDEYNGYSLKDNYPSLYVAIYEQNPQVSIRMLLRDLCDEYMLCMDSDDVMVSRFYTISRDINELQLEFAIRGFFFTVIETKE